MLGPYRYTSIDVLRVQRGHVIIVLRLVHVTSDGRAEAVLIGEAANGEVRPAGARELVNGLLVEARLAAGLQVQQETVTVEAHALGWTRAPILGEHLSAGEVRARYVDDQPVQDLAEFRILAAGCVWICTAREK